MSIPAVEPQPADSAEALARALTDARRAATPLPGFPGEIPDAMPPAYAVQDAGIGLWNDEIVGWKVGKVPDALQAKLKEERLTGPIFRRNLWIARDGEAVDFPVFVGGFAAVEAEFVFRIGADADPASIDYTPDEAAALVGALHIGVETAGSPMAAINDLGSTVVASDFGNNAGLILGGEVADWRTVVDGLTAETFVEGRSVGRGGAASLPGGPLAALAFAAGHCARRGRPLKAGQLISTGAATGIHDIVAGQSARVVFDGQGEILCRAVPAKGE